MTYNFLTGFVFVILTANFPQQITALTADEKSNVEKGIEAGKTIAETIKDGDYRKFLVNLGKNVAPFLGVLGPLAGIAMSFIPGGDPVMDLLKKEFAEINTKLDIILDKFDEVKKAIDWSTVLTSYGQYENKITLGAKKLSKIKGSEKRKKAGKKEFLKYYKKHFGNSLEFLYNGVMSDSPLLSKDVIGTFLKNTDNHNGMFEQFTMGLTRLFIYGINVEVSFYFLKGEKKRSKFMTKRWSKRMKRWRDKIQSVSDKLRENYQDQLKIDAMKILREDRKKENEEIAQKMFKFFIDKYNWRYWFVAVYNGIIGSDVHHLRYRREGHYHIFREYNKNLVIQSIEKPDNNETLLAFNASTKILFPNMLMRQHELCPLSEYGNERAKALVNEMDRHIKFPSKFYSLRMAVKQGSELATQFSKGYASSREVLVSDGANCPVERGSAKFDLFVFAQPWGT